MNDKERNLRSEGRGRTVGKGVTIDLKERHLSKEMRGEGGMRVDK